MITPSTEFEDCSTATTGDYELICNQLQAVELRQEELHNDAATILTTLSDTTINTDLWLQALVMLLCIYFIYKAITNTIRV